MIQEHGRLEPASFRPHPLLPGAHAQTMLAHLLRPTPRLPLEIERWERPDGDFVDLGWFARPQGQQPIAVLVHGLTGGFQSKYLRGTARRLRAAGWGGVVLQLRGAGDTPNRLPRAYHQGDTGDLLALLEDLRQRHPQSLLAMLGWSLGGNVVLRAAGQTAAACPADLVAAASDPFRLEPCAERLRQGASRIYQQRLLRDLQRAARAKAAQVPLPAAVDLAATQSARDFFAYDDAWTAPLNGFADARDYYRRTECGAILAQIERPCLIVHSRDDPFMTADIVPDSHQLGPRTRLEIAARGGHVGFVGRGRWGLPECWLERRLTAWLEDQRRDESVATTMGGAGAAAGRLLNSP